MGASILDTSLSGAQLDTTSELPTLGEMTREQLDAISTPLPWIGMCSFCGQTKELAHEMGYVTTGGVNRGNAASCADEACVARYDAFLRDLEEQDDEPAPAPHSVDVTDLFASPTFGDLLLEAHADLGLITETGKAFADAVAAYREIRTRRYIQKDLSARELVNTHGINYTAAEKVATLHPDFAAHEAKESAAEHAKTLAEAEYKAAQERAKLSVALVGMRVQGAIR